MAPPPQQPPEPSASLHRDDADDDDESVKQLQQCSSLYLSLQELEILSEGYVEISLLTSSIAQISVASGKTMVRELEMSIDKP
ncbi:hypothetical protein CDL15_Pgr016247 [Punica granatum]|uniref:Uncharacterized protein n=1 Tax=Punica granatum TaxID=22663 RepID=A0A218X0S4_PUNGR|nr:hypothetical protein CDL15_Pgr016247 [Punica granatum]